jgi:hypothetical protein
MNILRAGLAEDGPALAGDGRLEPSTAVVAEASVITVGPAPNAVGPVGAITLSLASIPELLFLPSIPSTVLVLSRPLVSWWALAPSTALVPLR